jgi:hypothetical protein
MTDATAMDEFDTVLGVMIAEREDDRTRLNAAQLGIVRHLARLTISDDPRDAKILTDLLPLAPRVISPGRLPPPTLEQVTRDDAERDICRLSNAQLAVLEELDAVMAGRAMPVVSERQEAALALTWLLDGGAKPEVARVRELIVAVLRPALAVEDVFPTHLAELEAERSCRRALEDEVKRLEHALERAAQPLPANVASFARARAEREAPTVVRSNTEILGEMLGSRPGAIGDHPGIGVPLSTFSTADDYP